MSLLKVNNAGPQFDLILFQTSPYKSFENTMFKGEIARNE